MNLLQKYSSKESRKNATNSLKRTALNKIANLLVTTDEKGEKERKYTYINGSSADYIPIKDIINGVIVTKDNRYISITEYRPTNFNQKTYDQQNNIISYFSSIFRNGPLRASLHILTDKYYPNLFIDTISKNCKNERNYERINSINNYKKHIYSESEKASVTKRFLLVLQYEGDINGHKSTNLEEILEVFDERVSSVIGYLESCGNTVIRSSDTQTITTCELLYYFFNRTTCRNQTFKERYDRIQKDYKQFNEETGMSKKASFGDIIAPKGLYFDSRDYIYQDGQYYCYLGIKGDSWPSQVYKGWGADLYSGLNYLDVTFIFNRLPKDVTKKSLQIINRNKRHTIWSKQNKRKLEDAEKHISKYKNNQRLIDAIDSGDDVYNVDLIFTIRASTEKTLGQRKRKIIKHYEESFKFEDNFLSAEDYYRATMPFLCSSSVLSRLHHNMTSTQIGCMYPFISLEINDTDGYLLGTDMEKSSLVINNNFANRYPNGHTVLIGKSGMGKTFTEMTIGGRCSLNGMRVTCICPVKGFEYEGLCKIHNGSYIRLTPGSENCVNPMEIHVEDNANTSVFKDDTISIKQIGVNLLTKKIAMLLVWFKLNLYGKDRDSVTFNSNDASKMQQLLTKLYYRFGITTENDSLKDSNGKLKKMPILSDWQNDLMNDPELSKYAYVLDPYTCGIGSNLNNETNVDQDSLVTVYDVDSEVIPEELIAAYIYLAFSVSYDRIKENISIRDVLILDEIWRMLKIKECAEEVQKAIKLMRSYYGCCLIATQELDDFFGKAGEFARSVLQNSTFKIFMGMDESAMKVFRENYKITDEEANMIMSFDKGEALLYAGSNKLKVKISTTEREFKAYDTNGNTRSQQTSSY